jgi:ADP-ribose pyrophosphatase
MKRAGEEDEECARRELLEETVYRARVLRMAWSFHPVPVLHRENNVVSRKGLEKAEQRLNEDEAIEVVEIPVGGALEMLRNGLAEDAKTIKGYAGWLRNRPGCWERLGTNTHIFQH